MKTLKVCLLINLICVPIIILLLVFIIIMARKKSKPKSNSNVQAEKFVVLPMLHDGVGNQLFMISAALALARATDREVVIYSSAWNPHQSADKYVNTIFRTFNTVHQSIDTNKYARVQYDTFSAWNPRTALSEETIGRGNVVTDGYFQYFPAIQPIEKELISMFRKNLSLSKGDMQNAIGLHVRRGDYLSTGYSVTPLSYFQAAIAFMKARVHASVPFILFTDDPVWCRAQSLFSACVLNNERDDIKCLAAMACCRTGFICCNSTYSWWGAFLGAHHAGGIVCAPSKWVNSNWVNPRHGTLYPPTWTILDAE